MIRTLLAALLLAVGAGCGTLDLYAPGGDVLLRSGTSFGMCIGHCVTEMTVQGDQARLAASSTDPLKYPPYTRTLTLTPAERQELLAAIDPGAFRSLEGVHGCPDCADGGAEWIEMDGRRVAFEYGADLPRIRPLLREVRELRARFREER